MRKIIFKLIIIKRCFFSNIIYSLFAVEIKLKQITGELVSALTREDEHVIVRDRHSEVETARRDVTFLVDLQNRHKEQEVEVRRKFKVKQV